MTLIGAQFTNEPTTVNSVLNSADSNITLPNFKITTFYRLLKVIGFKYEKRGNKDILDGWDDIIVLRRSYLKKMKRLGQKIRISIFLIKRGSM